MKDKKFLIILLSAVFLLVVVILMIKGGFFKKTTEQKESMTGLPESVERYYQESTPQETASPIKDNSDLEALSDEIDSTSVNFDSDLRELDKDFASF